MWAVLWAAPLAMPVPGNSDDVPQLPLPPSNVRAWRLPGLPSKSRIIRVLECEYAHLENPQRWRQECGPWSKSYKRGIAYASFAELRR